MKCLKATLAEIEPSASSVVDDKRPDWPDSSAPDACPDFTLAATLIDQVAIEPPAAADLVLDPCADAAPNPSLSPAFDLAPDSHPVPRLDSVRSTPAKAASSAIEEREVTNTQAASKPVEAPATTNSAATVLSDMSLASLTCEEFATPELFLYDAAASKKEFADFAATHSTLPWALRLYRKRLFSEPYAHEYSTQVVHIPSVQPYLNVIKAQQAAHANASIAAPHIDKDTTAVEVPAPYNSLLPLIELALMEHLEPVQRPKLDPAPASDSASELEPTSAFDSAEAETEPSTGASTGAGAGFGTGTCAGFRDGAGDTAGSSVLSAVSPEGNTYEWGIANLIRPVHMLLVMQVLEKMQPVSKCGALGGYSGFIPDAAAALDPILQGKVTLCSVSNDHALGVMHHLFPAQIRDELHQLYENLCQASDQSILLRLQNEYEHLSKFESLGSSASQSLYLLQLRKNLVQVEEEESACGIESHYNNMLTHLGINSYSTAVDQALAFHPLPTSREELLTPVPGVEADDKGSVMRGRRGVCDTAEIALSLSSQLRVDDAGGDKVEWRLDLFSTVPRLCFYGSVIGAMGINLDTALKPEFTEQLNMMESVGIFTVEMQELLFAQLRSDTLELMAQSAFTLTIASGFALSELAGGVLAKVCDSKKMRAQEKIKAEQRKRQQRSRARKAIAADQAVAAELKAAAAAAAAAAVAAGATEMAEAAEASEASEAGKAAGKAASKAGAGVKRRKGRGKNKNKFSHCRRITSGARTMFPTLLHNMQILHLSGCKIGAWEQTFVSKYLVGLGHSGSVKSDSHDLLGLWCPVSEEMAATYPDARSLLWLINVPKSCNLDTPLAEFEFLAEVLYGKKYSPVQLGAMTLCVCTMEFIPPSTNQARLRRKYRTAELGETVLAAVTRHNEHNEQMMRRMVRRAVQMHMLHCHFAPKALLVADVYSSHSGAALSLEPDLHAEATLQRRASEILSAAVPPLERHYSYILSRELTQGDMRQLASSYEMALLLWRGYVQNNESIYAFHPQCVQTLPLLEDVVFDYYGGDEEGLSPAAAVTVAAAGKSLAEQSSAATTEIFGKRKLMAGSTSLYELFPPEKASLEHAAVLEAANAAVAAAGAGVSTGARASVGAGAGAGTGAGAGARGDATLIAGSKAAVAVAAAAAGNRVGVTLGQEPSLEVKWRHYCGEDEVGTVREVEVAGKSGMPQPRMRYLPLFIGGHYVKATALPRDQVVRACIHEYGNWIGKRVEEMLTVEYEKFGADPFDIVESRVRSGDMRECLFVPTDSVISDDCSTEQLQQLMHFRLRLLTKLIDSKLLDDSISYYEVYHRQETAEQSDARRARIRYLAKRRREYLASVSRRRKELEKELATEAKAKECAVAKAAKDAKAVKATKTTPMASKS